jgi:hypothetical protein
MAEDQQTPTTTDLQRQIKDIGARMDDGFREIKDMMRDSQIRLQNLELKEAASAPAVGAKMDTLQRDLDCERKRIDDCEKEARDQATSITQLKEQNKLLLWLAAIEGAGVLTWIIPNVLKMIGK